MSVKVHWVNEEEKTIVQYSFEGKWTWEEFYPEYNKAIEMEKSQAHRVDVVMDFRKSVGIPPNALTHLKNITDKQPDNIGLSIFVTTNNFLNVMFHTGERFYPKVKQYFTITETMETAFQMIEEDRKKREAT